MLGTSALSSNRLFTFGDRDGPVANGLLQHPLGVVCVGQRLYIADTYNNKIKVIDLKSSVIRTLAGTFQPGKSDSPARFDEPAGISYAAGKLYVADTNNHAIRVLDLTARSVSTLVIDGLPSPGPAEPATAFLLPGFQTVMFEPVSVKPVRNRFVVDVQLELPAGHKLNPSAPLQYTIQAGSFVNSDFTGKTQIPETTSTRFTVQVPLQSKTGKSRFELAVKFFYCQQGLEAICRIASVKFAGDVTLSAKAPSTRLQLRHTVR